MLGYYPQREEQELIYSTTARARAILYPDQRGEYVAQRFLGSPTKSFGGILPNNCRLLQRNVPDIAGLSDASILDGSVYHLLAPFLNPEERTQLRESLFEGQGFGARNWFEIRPLKYCVYCARDDERAGTVRHWRVLHNHPAVICCDLHGVRLCEVEVMPRNNELHDPAKWIRLDVPSPSNASADEIAVAADVRWLYGQKSKYLPGFEMVVLTLRKLLLDAQEFRTVDGLVARRRIIAQAMTRMPEAFAALDPRFFTLSPDDILTKHERAPLQRYSLIARLVGARLQDVIEKTMQIREITVHSTCRSTQLSGLANCKQRLVDLIRRQPTQTRHGLFIQDPNAVNLVRKLDRGWYERNLPAPRRSRISPADWADRDQELCVRIRKGVTGLGADSCLSVVRILRNLGISSNYFWRNRKRLPGSASLLKATAGQAKELWGIRRMKNRLTELTNRHPEWGRARIVISAGYTCKAVRKCDLAFYDRIMPPRRWGKYMSVDWSARDSELCQQLALSQVNSDLMGCRSIAAVLRCMGWRRDLFSNAAGRLPETYRYIRSIVAAPCRDYGAYA